MTQFRNQLPADGALGDAPLVDLVRPSVACVRRELFGAEAAPFPTLSAAVEWIESPTPKSRENLERQRELVRLVEAASRLGLGRITYSGPPSLPYRKPRSRTVHRWGTAPDGSLRATLAARAEEIAAVTGWHAADVAMWILLDREPDPVPRVRCSGNERSETLPAGDHLTLQTITVEIYKADVSDDEWRRLRTQIRKAFHRNRKRSLKKEDGILDKVVRRYGEATPDGETWANHWQTIANKCNDLVGYTWFADHHGPYMRWQRLRKKIRESQEHRWWVDAT